MEVLESQIEDILVSSPALLQSMLNLEEEPRLLTRQMMTPSGRLDLLLAYQTRLLLVELKVVAFRQEFVRQVLNYKSDLLTYQASGKLLRGDIQPYLLCTSASQTQRRTSATSGVMCFDYNPEHILQYFYQNLRPIAFFAEIKPIDIGIWNLHLIHDFIYLLEKVKNVSQLRSLVKGSSKTLYNKVNYPVAEPRGIFKNQKLTAYCHDTLYITLLPLPLPHPQHSLQNTHHSKTPLPKAPLSPLEIP